MISESPRISLTGLHPTFFFRYRSKIFYSTSQIKVYANPLFNTLSVLLKSHGTNLRKREWTNTFSSTYEHKKKLQAIRLREISWWTNPTDIMFETRCISFLETYESLSQRKNETTKTLQFDPQILTVIFINFHIETIKMWKNSLFKNSLPFYRLIFLLIFLREKILPQMIQPLSLNYTYTHAHTHTHIYIYIYIYICVCVCVCVCEYENMRKQNIQKMGYFIL